MCIQNKAMVVNLTIRQWSARKFDRKATSEVETNHNTKNAGRFNKILIAVDELKKVSKVANQIRGFHYANTLPWGDDGSRLLPSANFLNYSQKIGELKNEFETAVNKFCVAYPSLIQEAQVRLNGLFNPLDYPADVSGCFEVKTVFTPVPDAGDFRVNLEKSEIEELENSLRTELQNRIEGSKHEVWERIKGVLQAMVSRLGEKKAIFRDSLITNISDLIELLPKLNFSEDSAINDMCESLKVLLCNPEELRNNSLLRNAKAKEAEELLSKVNSYF